MKLLQTQPFESILKKRDTLSCCNYIAVFWPQNIVWIADTSTLVARVYLLGTVNTMVYKITQALMNKRLIITHCIRTHFVIDLERGDAFVCFQMDVETENNFITVIVRTIYITSIAVSVQCFDSIAYFMNIA